MHKQSTMTCVCLPYNNLKISTFKLRYKTTVMLTASFTNYLLMCACAGRAIIFKNSKGICHLPILKYYCFNTGKRS